MPHIAAVPVHHHLRHLTPIVVVVHQARQVQHLLIRQEVVLPGAAIQVVAEVEVHAAVEEEDAKLPISDFNIRASFNILLIFYLITKNQVSTIGTGSMLTYT